MSRTPETQETKWAHSYKHPIFLQREGAGGCRLGEPRQSLPNSLNQGAVARKGTQGGYSSPGRVMNKRELCREWTLKSAYSLKHWIVRVCKGPTRHWDRTTEKIKGQSLRITQARDTTIPTAKTRNLLIHKTQGIVLNWLPMWCSVKESACQWRRCGFNPGVRKIPWRRKLQPTPVFLPGKSHGQRGLAGYSSWCCKELDMTEHTQTLCTQKTLVSLVGEKLALRWTLLCFYKSLIARLERIKHFLRNIIMFLRKKLTET